MNDRYCEGSLYPSLSLSSFYFSDSFSTFSLVVYLRLIVRSPHWVPTYLRTYGNNFFVSWKQVWTKRLKNVIECGRKTAGLWFSIVPTETSGKKRVVGKFANQDSSRSVYWIVTREGRYAQRERERGIQNGRSRGHWHSIREELSLKVEY